MKPERSQKLLAKSFQRVFKIANCHVKA